MYEALIKALRTCVDKDKDCSDCPYAEKCGADKTGRLVPMVDAAQALEDSIDSVPVVRCKDCRWSKTFHDGNWCRKYHHDVGNDWYCAGGERKDNVSP